MNRTNPFHRFRACLWLALTLLAGLCPLWGADERPIVGDQTPVRVKYQYQSAGSTTWNTSETTLRGAVSESMMINQISARHPGKQIRILSAVVNGKTVRVQVKFQSASPNGNWSTSTTTLQNALTESMARNQLAQRFPGKQIRILSMIRQ